MTEQRKNKQLKEMYKNYLNRGNKTAPALSKEVSKDPNEEEFEVVAVKPSPAVSKNRPKQLKWKQEGAGSGEKASNADSPTQAVFEKEKESHRSKEKVRWLSDREVADCNKEESATIKRKIKEHKKARRKSKSPTGDESDSLSGKSPPETVDVEPLRDKLAIQLATEARLRQRLEKRDKKIASLEKELKEKKQTIRALEKQARKQTTEELRTYIAEIDQLKLRLKEIEELTGIGQTGGGGHAPATTVANQKVESVPSSASSHTDRDEKLPARKGSLDASTLEIACSVLGMLKRNQLMEIALNRAETNQISLFFGDKKTAPNSQIVMLLDKAIGSGLDVMLNRPHELDDVIDNKMRVFVMDKNKAKTVLLEVLLSHPQFVPIGWGGKGSQQNNIDSNKSSAEHKSVKVQSKPNVRASPAKVQSAKKVVESPPRSSYFS